MTYSNITKKISVVSMWLPRKSPFLYDFTIEILFIVLIGFFLAGCDSKPEGKKIDLKEKISQQDLEKEQNVEKSKPLIFGFDLRRSVEEDTRQYVPFLKYLEKETDLKFKIHFTAKDAIIADDLGTGVLQFASVGADTYIIANEKYGVIPIVRGLNTKNKAEYQSVLITAPNSPIKTIDELRGKRFAFGSKTSTQGHLIPRIILAQHNIMLEDLAAYEWTGSHRNCANAVSSGKFDAGGMQDTLGLELASAGLIKILYISRYYPSSGIAANKNVPDDIVKKVKKALISFEPKGRHAMGLYNWDKTEMPHGFREAHDEDYHELRDWSKKLGLLK